MAKKRKTRSGPKEWSPRKEVQSFAQEFAEDATKMPKDFMYRGDLPIGETWGYVFGRSRDSGLVEESNWDIVKADMEERFPDDVQEERHNHFLVGWVDQLAIRLLDKDGVATQAADAAYEWTEKLADYPLADEEDHSRREYEATIENIQSEGGIDEDLAGEVYSWLWDNNQSAIESHDDRGGYPEEKDIHAALWEMNKPTEEMIEDRQAEEDEAKAQMSPEQLEAWRRREYQDPPEQGKLFGRMGNVSKEWDPGPDRLPPFVGQCVRLRREVDRWDSFRAPPGLTGEIIHYSPGEIRVRMHQPLDGAEHWDNEIHWMDDTIDQFLDDIKVLPRCPRGEE